MSIEIIEAREGDFEYYWPMFSSWLTDIGSRTSRIESKNEFLRILRTGVMFIAKSENMHIGFICGMIGQMVWDGYNTVFHHLWYVKPECRGKNIGVMLAARLEEWAKRQKCKAIVFTMAMNGENNPKDYKPVLEKHGYNLHGLLMRKEF